MAVAAKKVCCGEAGRAAAYNGDFLSGVGLYRDDVAVVAVQDLVSGKHLEECNADGLLDELTTAGVLTGVRTYTANGGGDGERIVDGLHRVFVTALGNFLYIFLAVGHSRAVQLTWAAAVSGVVGEDELKSGLAGPDDTLGVGVDHIALPGFGRAGPEQFRDPFHLDDTDAAGTVDSGLVAVAEGGDINSGTGG